jgi:hypothetical protein
LQAGGHRFESDILHHWGEREFETGSSLPAEAIGKGSAEEGAGGGSNPIFSTLGEELRR